tara:strand:+ start:626 stop:823 length:198 start_codon:yes stop_codon:yes gene_type:complete
VGLLVLLGGAFLVYKREEIYDRWQAAALAREMRMSTGRQHKGQANAVQMQMQVPPAKARKQSGEL